MNKNIIKIICIAGISTLLLAGCSNENDYKEKVNKGNEISSESDSSNKEEANTTDKPNTVDSSQSEEISKEENVALNKQEYIDKMDALDEDLKLRLKDKLAGTTLDMREAGSEIYTEWDKMLNEVYSKIISTLSQEEKDKLIAEEKAWIEERDKKADEAAKQFEGGTMEPLAQTDSLGASTKERCYELVNNYMK